MSTTASRYADYGSACPRCQQIINTIDITFQQGIFIYDLTFIQQELESVLVAALQREHELLQEDADILKLPSSSMIRLANGKKPRDFKAERERRRKALGGQTSRKRRIKKNSTKHFLTTIKRERNHNGSILSKKDSWNSKIRSDMNGNSSRPIRSYRPISFTFPYYYETNYRNGNNHNLSTNKLQLNNIPYPDQFWTKILTNQYEFIKDDKCNFIDKLIHIDQSLLNNFDYEKEYNQYKDIINSNEYIFSHDKYIHPELEYSVVIKQNSHLYSLVENMLNNNQHKNGSTTTNNHRLKRKHSAISNNNHNSLQIDESILNLFRREENTFTSKYAELQHRLAESLSLERLALDRARKQCKLDTIQIEINEIDDKILEITNSIRQRKRPSENAVSLCKPASPIDNNCTNHHQNEINESEAWRKGRRQSTLRVYDELARLVDERIDFEKQIIEINPSIQL
ncbi:unnamed protein product [Adineta steineri]|uniref:Uncharacterized protein n=1 Tax=Adineta steineri TaxID=433720 RepID=A0A814KW07_9BILA|nr:unnamed protein product [Adineta steineri]CAF1086935.1 unnamed protein product [Adineta steineri]